MPNLPPALTEPDAARLLARWGFLADPDLPDRPGPAYLIVALRDRPTYEHFDPEVVEAPAMEGGRLTVTRQTRVSIDIAIDWGLIRVVDRLSISNEFLTFGARLRAVEVGDMTVCLIESPVPLLRRGGHSQPSDRGAQSLGAYFGRFRALVESSPWLARLVAEASPEVRYSAFVADAMARFKASAELREEHPELFATLCGERHRLQRESPAAWERGVRLSLVTASPEPVH